MKIGVDSNILVQAAIESHILHQRAKALIQRISISFDELLIPAPVLTEFLHVVTDERRFLPAVPMKEAIRWIEGFLATPIVRLVYPSAASVKLTFDWMLQFQLGRKRILDTHFAAILHVEGARHIATANQHDFEVFKQFAFEIL